ncbi:MAG: T9SS type A sorting domain-containing protein [Sphingobacteriales bacterium]|nr:MAG: T9SS type A sorting domain-containing protein [Sphingobacteriales bacterium]
MKFIYVIISALLFANLAGAKGTTIESVTATGGPGIGGVGILPPHFGSGSNGRGAKGEYRLVAKTFLNYRNGAITPVDSITYSFSGNRNGYTKKDDWNNDETVLFDESYTYVFSDVSRKYDQRYRRFQVYNADNTVNKVTYGQMQDYGQWKDTARYLYDYDDKGKMISSGLEVLQGVAWTLVKPSEISYNTVGVITEMNSLFDKLQLEYDGTKLKSSTHSARVGSGTGGWSLVAKTNYTYTGDNVTTTVDQVWNASVNDWVNVNRIEYIYSGTTLEGTEEFTWDGFNWQQSKTHSYTYDTKGNKLTDLLQTWNISSHIYVNAKKEIYSYNMYSQPLNISTYTWKDNAWGVGEGDTELRFYYDFPTSVASVDVEHASVHTYPVPATDIVNLNIDWTIPQQFSIALLDAQGRVVRQWEEAPQVKYLERISVSDLASGNYFIKVTGERTQMTERLVISK